MNPDLNSVVNNVDPDQLASEEMGPGWTSRVWYFHTPDKWLIHFIHCFFADTGILHQILASAGSPHREVTYNKPPPPSQPPLQIR